MQIGSIHNINFYNKTFLFSSKKHCVKIVAALFSKLGADKSLTDSYSHRREIYHTDSTFNIIGLHSRWQIRALLPRKSGDYSLFQFKGKWLTSKWWWTIPHQLKIHFVLYLGTLCLNFQDQIYKAYIKCIHMTWCQYTCRYL